MRNRGAELHFQADMNSIIFHHSLICGRTRFFRRISTTLFLVLIVCLSACNRDPKKFLAKGNVSFDQGKYPEALIYYGRAIQLDPRYAEAHFNLALALHEAGNETESQAEFQKAYEIAPELRNQPHP